MVAVMEKLAPVEEAKELLSVAKHWPILKWLAEKKRVRNVADTGTAALDQAEQKVKGTWSETLKIAYAELCAPSEADDDPFAAAELQFVKQHTGTIDEVIKAAARRVKDADDKAYRARMTAERTFDDAERRLSAGLARKGAEQAIEAYDLRYRAIEEAEAAQRL
jgi:hypothetical protein